MKGPEIHIAGADTGDLIFSTSLPDVPEITWNITRMQRAALLGFFGPPKRVAMTELPPLTDQARANIKWKKVRKMVKGYRKGPGRVTLEMPALMVLFRSGGLLRRAPVDGNHRITARRELGLPDFICHEVPADMEGHFRVTMDIFR